MRRAVIGLGIVAALLAVPAQVMGQGFGIGPHISFVKGNVGTGTPAERFFGGSLRMGSKHVALEASLDYRSYLNEAGTLKIRETPLQGSLLIFPIRSVIAPYLLGGAGLYSRTLETVGGVPNVTASTSERKFGAHVGLGGEVFFGRHVAFFLDYRYRFVKWGTPEVLEDEPINIPGGSIIPGLDKVKLTHQGSMWTTGVTFYF